MLHRLRIGACAATQSLNARAPKVRTSAVIGAYYSNPGHGTMTKSFPFGRGEKPPVSVPQAVKAEKILEQFGEKRSDPWYWLRSDSRVDEKVWKTLQRLV